MFRNLFAAALLAALCAGLVFSVIQHFRLTPLIIAAESFEVGPAPHAHVGEEAVAPHTHEVEEWAPQEGAERTAYTVLANLLATAGYALVLGAVSVIAGLPITAANGVLWGLGGYAAFSLAPAFGLPPGLPGMAVADTLARQVWWWGTALATGAAIILCARARTPWAIAAAAALVALPHLVGAPRPPDDPTAVPASLAASFTAAVLFANAAMWVVLGATQGWLTERFAHRAARTATKEAHA